MQKPKNANAGTRNRTECEFKYGAHLMKRAVSLSDVAKRFILSQLNSQVEMMWTNAWQQTAKHMQHSRQADQMKSGNRNPRHSSIVHHVHNHQDPNITEIHETYIIGTVLQHTSIIQHQFNLILLMFKDSSEESFTCQHSNPHNYLKTQ